MNRYGVRRLACALPDEACFGGRGKPRLKSGGKPPQSIFQIQSFAVPASNGRTTNKVVFLMTFRIKCFSYDGNNHQCTK
jgi:hypothetical protein